MWAAGRESAMGVLLQCEGEAWRGGARVWGEHREQRRPAGRLSGVLEGMTGDVELGGKKWGKGEGLNS